MIDLNTLAGAALELWRQHGPWLGEKLAGAAVGLAAKETWELLRTKLITPGGQEAVQKVEAQPEIDRHWDTLKNHLLDSLEQDAAFREKLTGLVPESSIQQFIQGSGNKQAGILNSPGSTILQS